MAFAAIERDITGRKETERRFVALGERLSLATDIANIGVWEFDLVSGELLWDDKMYEIYGFPERPEEKNYDLWRSRLHPDDVEAAEQNVQDAVVDGVSFDAEFRIVHDDGSIRIILGKGYVTRDEGGQPISMVGVNFDITAQKEAENQMKEAMEQAEATSRLKSEFLANMSHEIRTPMNGVVGITNLLLQSNLPADVMRYVRLPESSGESLMRVINDILDFSKIESGQLDLENIKFNLHNLFGDLGEVYGLKAEERKLPLILDVDPSLPQWSYGDPGRLRQIISNLLSNALKFTEEGEITLRAKLELEHDSSFVLKVDVVDTGQGISEEKQEEMFKSFTQADASITREFGGTGLGLAICRQLVELMGGEIGVQSELGQGACFTFEVRLGKAEDRKDSDEKRSRDLQGKVVMLVVEEESHDKTLVPWLERWD